MDVALAIAAVGALILWVSLLFRPFRTWRDVVRVAAVGAVVGFLVGTAERDPLNGFGLAVSMGFGTALMYTATSDRQPPEGSEQPVAPTLPPPGKGWIIVAKVAPFVSLALFALVALWAVGLKHVAIQIAGLVLVTFMIVTGTMAWWRVRKATRGR